MPGITITAENRKAFELLTQERKAKKYFLMCFIYNQQYRRRTEEWKDAFVERFGSDSEYYLLSAFSKINVAFLENVFPKLTTQLNILTNVMLLVANTNLQIKVGTL